MRPNSQTSALHRQPSFIEVLHSTSKPKKDTLLFDQYKIFIEHDERLRDRRHQRNTFFLTTNSLIISVLGTLITKLNERSIHLILAIILLVIGIGFAAAWIKTLNAFSVLTNKSYQFIKEMETYSGSPVFTQFYEHLHPTEDSKLRRPFLTQKEKLVPYLFLLGYSLYTLYAVIHIWFLK
jgi:hypothetical protein